MLHPGDYDRKELSTTRDDAGAAELAPVDAYVLNKMLRYVAQPYEISEDDRNLVLEAARRVLENPNSDPRSMLAAQKIVVAADEVNLRRFEILDKVHRLDTGQATDNIQVRLDIPDTVNQRANP